MAEAALRLHPRLAGPGGPCIYVRADGARPDRVDRARSRPSSTAGHSRERCVQAGLSHVLADELLIDGRRAPAGRPGEHDGRASGRVSHGRPALPRRALTGSHRRSSTGAWIGERRDGTWVHVLELIAALGRSGAAEVRVIVPESPDRDLRGEARGDARRAPDDPVAPPAPPERSPMSFTVPSRSRRPPTWPPWLRWPTAW